MVEDGRYCIDILHQVHAARARRRQSDRARSMPRRVSHPAEIAKNCVVALRNLRKSSSQGRGLGGARRGARRGEWHRRQDLRPARAQGHRVTGPQPAALDLRLLLPCLGAWGIGAWALSWSGGVRASVALASVVGVLATRPATGTGPAAASQPASQPAGQ